MKVGQRRKVLLALMGFLGLPLTESCLAAERAYTCFAEQSVGFTPTSSGNGWTQTDFASGNVYTVTKADGANLWKVRALHGFALIGDCRGEFSKEGDIYCPGSPSLWFNRTTLRYYSISAAGDHVKDGIVKASFAPLMEVGHCSVY